MSGRDNWRFVGIGPRERKPRAVPSPAETPAHRGCARSKSPA